MKKYLTILLLAFFSANAFAAEPLTVKGDLQLNPDLVTDVSKKMLDQVLKGVAGKPLPAVYYGLFSGRIDLWCKYKYFEADTGYTMAWILNVKKHFEYLGKCADFCERAKANRVYDAPATSKVRKNFILTFDNLKRIIDNPVKVEKNQLRILRRKKQEWLKIEYRKLREAEAAKRRNR